MTPSVVEIRETVSVNLLSSLSSNFRSPYEAILELVDNGLASRRPDVPIRITLAGSGWSSRQGALKVVTRDGRGMGEEGLTDFLHWGKQPDGEGLNKYGQGGKAAIGYLGTGIRIRANRHGETQALELEDRDWLSRPDGQEKRFQARVVPAAVPGTGVVEIEIFDLRRQINSKRLEKELAWRYRPALVNGHLDIRVRGKKVGPASLEAERSHSFRHRVSVSTPAEPDGELVELRGWVGTARPKSESRGGIRCSAFGRVIVENEYFGHKTAAYKASLNSLIGEVDLSFVPPVLNKNAFDEASPAWGIARELVHREMVPWVESLLKRKDEAEPTDEERERAMEAKDLAHEALDRIAAETSSRGEGGARRGRKPPSRGGGEGPTVCSPRESTSPTPRTPPPPGAVGRLRRKGYAVEWDVRALDPRIRSATEEQDGRAEIVINSRYPLYRERAGDLPYMLETGLLEELKPSGEDERPVPEYLEEVWHALYEGLTSRA